MATTTDALATALSALLDRAKIVGLTRLSGGASRETWSFSAVEGNRSERALVLQRRPGGGAVPVSTAVGPEVEAQLLRAAGAAGVPVPAVVDASADSDAVGAPFLLMAAVEGETIARRILRDAAFAQARTGLPSQIGEALARLHQVAPGSVDGLDQPEPLGQLLAIIDLLGEPHPALELGLRWLSQNRPAPTPGGSRIVHGDFRLGNLIVGPDGLRAVIDWELAHLGDPMEDLGWLCVRAWRFGSPLPVAGVGQYAELFDAYEAAGGGRVDASAVRWWELFGTVRWGVICMMQAAGHLTGVVRSHELAAIGRRVCQNEHDVLELLAGPAPRSGVMRREIARSVTPEPAGWDGRPHDRPTVPELLEAVREWLEGDVMAQTDRRLRFHARVAANTLAIAERELALGPAQRAAHADRLAALSVADDAELAAAIRAGRFDGARWDAVTASVRAAVADKLAVADPGYGDPASAEPVSPPT